MIIIKTGKYKSYLKRYGFFININKNIMSFVNAYTQWGKLKRVVVGLADNACFQPKQPCHKPKINDDKHVSELLPWPSGPKHQRSIDKANYQLQNLCDLLNKEGV